MRFEQQDWDQRLWPKSAIGRVQAALHVTRYRRRSWVVGWTMVAIVVGIVGALAALGWVLS